MKFTTMLCSTALIAIALVSCTSAEQQMAQENGQVRRQQKAKSAKTTKAGPKKPKTTASPTLQPVPAVTEAPSAQPVPATEAPSPEPTDAPTVPFVSKSKASKKSKAAKSLKSVSTKSIKGAKAKSNKSTATPPETASPTLSPTVTPTLSPTAAPSALSSSSPTEFPTTSPSSSPTGVPTASPSSSPTGSPSSSPSGLPSPAPSASPTGSPSASPSDVPTSAPSDGPTPAPVPAPSVVPTSAPSDGPTPAPVPAPSVVPTSTPSDGPTPAPVPAPSVVPTSTPSDGPTPAPVPAPSMMPTAGPTLPPSTAGPTVSPSTAPSESPVISVPGECTHGTSNEFNFVPIAGSGTVINFNYTLYPGDAGYTDDLDDTTTEYEGGVRDQIEGIDDFTILDDGLMVFGNPWGCDRENDAGCSNFTLQIFDVYDNRVNLDSDGKVFAEEKDDSVIVSWERVQDENGDGDVNVQAQLFNTGLVRVCFGCGSLPPNLEVALRTDVNDERGLTDTAIDFGPDDSSTWPADQCFSYTPPAVATAPSITQCQRDTTSEPRFEPIASSGVEIDFNFTIVNNDFGFTDDNDDAERDQIEGIDDFTILDNGLLVFGRPWGCDRGTAGCTNTTLQIFEGYYYASYTLVGEGKVFAKEDTDSVTVSWERVQGREQGAETPGDGDVNVQAKLFDDGRIQVCFGCGSLPTGVTLAMLVDDDGLADGNDPISFGPDDGTYPENQCFSLP